MRPLIGKAHSACWGKGMELRYAMYKDEEQLLRVARLVYNQGVLISPS